MRRRRGEIVAPASSRSNYQTAGLMLVGRSGQSGMIGAVT